MWQKLQSWKRKATRWIYDEALVSNAYARLRGQGKVAFVFTGFGGKILGMSAPKLSKELIERGYRVHVFKDSRQSMFIDGGDDHESSQALRAFMKSHTGRATQSLAVVCSGAGFGGTLHATAVGVDRIVGFSAFTTIDIAARAVDRRGKAILGQLDELIPDDKQRNLRHVKSVQDASSRIDLIFPDGNAADRYQAENLADFANVTLHPIPSVKHNMHDADDSLADMLDWVGV